MALVGIIPYVSLSLVKLQAPLMSGLETAAARVQGGQADAACQRWFGDTSQAWKKELATTLRKWRSNINVRTIKVGFAPRDDRGANAASWRTKNGLDFSTQLNGTGTNDHMNLDEGFSSLPEYLPLQGGVVDATFYSQSKYETLVHELSHLLLNTKDVPVGFDSDGDVKEAYGAKRSAKLAINDPAKAKRNAENWGIFVEAVGIHKSS